MVDESDRLWKNIDEIHTKVDNLCVQVAKIDNYIKFKERRATRNYALMGIVLTTLITGLNLFLNNAVQ